MLVEGEKIREIWGGHMVESFVGELRTIINSLDTQMSDNPRIPVKFEGVSEPVYWNTSI